MMTQIPAGWLFHAAPIVAGPKTRKPALGTYCASHPVCILLSHCLCISNIIIFYLLYGIFFYI